MKALLLYPQFPDTFWSFKHALKFIHKRAASPPLGLMTVAALLPAEWDKRLIDVNVRRLRDKDLAWADCVFISAMVVQRSSARELVRRCKAAGLRVVVGGPLFAAPEEHWPEVDHFVLNEGELTLPPFLDDLARGCARRIYATDQYADMTTTPAPLWHMADLKRYASMSVQYSRGCPYQCEFCNVTALFGHRPRTKTAAQIIAELDALRAVGWRGSVFFVDDNFIGNKKRLKETLLPALIEWHRTRPNITFHTEVSIDLADDEELMRMMVDAGFDQVFIGIETPDEKGLSECHKGQNRGRDLVADVKRIQRAGLQVQAGFIVGFDSDTPSIFERQIEFIQKSGIVTAMVGLLQAPPGTRLYERLKEQGRLLSRGLSGDNVDGSTNIIPKMNFQTLREGYCRILDHIYSPEHYYARLKTFLRECGPPQMSTRPRLNELLAFARSIVQLGVLGKERVHYWKLVLWTQFRRPELFPLMIKLAICGYHFRRVCALRAEWAGPGCGL